MNVREWLEFEHAYYDVEVQLISHSTTTPSFIMALFLVTI